MERILFEKDDLGNFTYFIHAPDLCYKIDQSGALICFHADAQANIIALSGAGQTNLAQYAYTPYGRVLGSTNLQSQISNPYLFVGSQGVMEEVPGLYFMRARYYSAEAGVFLSTDPVKKIGPGWKSVAYGYAGGSPLLQSDPRGEFHVPSILLALGIYYFIHEMYLKPTEAVLEIPEKFNQQQVGALSEEEATEFKERMALKPFELVPGGDVGVGVGYALSGRGSSELVKAGTGYIPGVTEYRILQHFGATLGFASIGIENSLKSSRGSPSGGVKQSMPNRTVASSTPPAVLNPVQTTPTSSPSGNSGNNGGGSGGSGGTWTSSQQQAIGDVIDAFAPPPGQAWTPAQQQAIINVINAFSPSTSNSGGKQ